MEEPDEPIPQGKGQDPPGTGGTLVPPGPSQTEAPRTYLMELMIVFGVLVLPSVCGGIEFLLQPWEHAPKTLPSGILGLVCDLGAIGLLFYLVSCNRESLQVLGLRRTRWWVEVLWAAAIVWASWWTYKYARVITVPMGLEPWPEEQQAISGSTALKAALPVFLLASAFLEETLFRAYLWNRMVQWTRAPFWSLVFCSAVFALIHCASPAVLIQHFVSGLVLGAFYWLGRSTPRLVLAHCARNLVVTYLAACPVVGPPVEIKNAEYFTARLESPSSAARSSEGVQADATERDPYASWKTFLDLRHVNCGSTEVVKSEGDPGGWCVVLWLNLEGRRASAKWTAENILRHVGFFVGGKHVEDALIKERSMGPIQLHGHYSKEEAEKIRDTVAAGGKL
jgi:membrane protease YdiL (CAAX protease family)